MPAPQPSTQPDVAVLAGTVERVTFHNAESGFCVLRVKARGFCCSFSPPTLIG